MSTPSTIKQKPLYEPPTVTEVETRLLKGEDDYDSYYIPPDPIEDDNSGDM